MPDFSELCREIAGDFDVSLNWLLTGRGRGATDETHDETVVYLPVALNEKFFEDALKKGLIAFGNYPCSPYDRYVVEMTCIEGIRELFCLYAARKPDEEEKLRISEKLGKLLRMAEKKQDAVLRYEQLPFFTRVVVLCCENIR